jgi:hypothetical protein
MALTEASLETNFNTYIGDSSTDRISAAERLQFATEATVWLQEETGNDHLIDTYTLNYLDGVHTYETTSAVASLLEGADLRREEGNNIISAFHKSSRELSEEIAQGAGEFSWAIERRNNKSYLVVNMQDVIYKSVSVSSLDSLTADGDTWEADTTNSDATNLTVDTIEYKEGGASLNFDITVAQSGNNRATILNDGLTAKDLSSYENLGSFLFRVYLPDVTNFSSITLYVGEDSSNYWSATATTELNGNAWANEWNQVKVNWADMTKTGSPDSSSINYIRFDFNYTGSQANDTDFRLDDLRIARPEKLTFYFTSWYVGTDTTGATPRLAFTATTDIPYFSGQYDQYKYAVSHKMASLAFYGPLQNPTLGAQHEVESIKALNRAKKLIPSSVTKEIKSFKVAGINFGRRR